MKYTALWCAALLPACVVLGPGAGGDDDDDDNMTEARGFAPPASTVIPPTAGSSAPTTTAGSSAPAPTTPNMPAKPEMGWSCTESSSGCNCSALSSLTGACVKDWSCCIASGNTCNCNASTACAAEAASRPGAMIVQHCPPDTQTRCAAENENCSLGYLQEQKLAGCCDGLVCKTGSSGVRACVPGTADEIALATQCQASQTGADLGSTLTVEAGSLTVGDDALELQLDGPVIAMAGAGECLASLDITLIQKDHASCRLDLRIGPDRNMNGDLQVSLFGGDDCVAGDGTPAYLTVSAGALTFTGASCESSLFASSLPGSLPAGWCFAGTFEVHLDGKLTRVPRDTGMSSETPFTDALVRMNGRVCSLLAGMEPCPAP